MVITQNSHTGHCKFIEFIDYFISKMNRSTLVFCTIFMSVPFTFIHKNIVGENIVNMPHLYVYIGTIDLLNCLMSYRKYENVRLLLTSENIVFYNMGKI